MRVLLRSPLLLSWSFLRSACLHDESWWAWPLPHSSSAHARGCAVPGDPGPIGVWVVSVMSVSEKTKLDTATAYIVEGVSMALNTLTDTSQSSQTSSVTRSKYGLRSRSHACPGMSRLLLFNKHRLTQL